MNVAGSRVKFGVAAKADMVQADERMDRHSEVTKSTMSNRDCSPAAKNRRESRRPVSPMRPELIRHYLRQQRQLESEGRWEDANWLNAWLSGAFISEEEFLEGRVAPMRAEFLERMRSG